MILVTINNNTLTFEKPPLHNSGVPASRHKASLQFRDQKTTQVFQTREKTLQERFRAIAQPVQEESSPEENPESSDRELKDSKSPDRLIYDKQNYQPDGCDEEKYTRIIEWLMNTTFDNNTRR